MVSIFEALEWTEVLRRTLNRVVGLDLQHSAGFFVRTFALSDLGIRSSKPLANRSMPWRPTGGVN